MSIGHYRILCLVLLCHVLSGPGYAQPSTVDCPGGQAEFTWGIPVLKVQGFILGATQRQQQFSGELMGVRNWNRTQCGFPSQRTLLDIIPSYDAKKSSTASPLNITRNYSAKFQHLIFLKSNRYYATVNADLYHNNSLGIYLQQGYGAGMGALLFDNSFEVSADIRGVGEHFLKGRNLSFPGSQLSERYSLPLTFIHPQATLSETLVYLLPFTEEHAWQIRSVVELSLPVTATLKVTAAAFDDYVRNAPAAFRRNYFRTSFGLQFSFIRK